MLGALAALRDPDGRGASEPKRSRRKASRPRELPPLKGTLKAAASHTEIATIRSQQLPDITTSERCQGPNCQFQALGNPVARRYRLQDSATEELVCEDCFVHLFPWYRQPPSEWGHVRYIEPVVVKPKSTVELVLEQTRRTLEELPAGWQEFKSVSVIVVMSLL